MGISILRSTATIPGPATPLDIATAADVGVSTRSARDDHVHRGVTTTAPADTAAAAVLGASLLAARGDHAHKIADSGWIAPTLVNAWENYPTFVPCGYRKIGTIVFLRGLLRNGTANLMFTLPAGYRPAGGALLFIADGSGAYGRVDIQSSGDVTRIAGGNGYIQMQHSFVADA